MNRLILAVGPILCLSGCGYHVAGKANLLPKDIQTIAIPAFGNASVRYKLADRLPAALTREFISRTRYSIVADPGQADATLSGVLVNYQAFPVVFDQTTGRASGMQIVVVMQVTLTDRNGKVLFTQPAMNFRERYEISVSETAYFEENEVALERLSRDVARTVVSSVLEMF
jgi:outer membrane lipopolysaccharide assembly protein LptE/RlpB